jgi:hypothetical protein
VKLQPTPQQLDTCSAVVLSPIKQDINAPKEVFQQQVHDVKLQPTPQQLDTCSAALNTVKKQSAADQQQQARSGPWSLDWLNQTPIAEGGIVFSSPCLNDIAEKNNQNSSSPFSSKNKKNGAIKRSLGFMKRVARMPDVDRREIIKILKKQDRKRRARKATQRSKAAVTSMSESTKNSSSSVNKDWENWVVLKGKAREVGDDARNIGKLVGVQYKCETTNSFNLLTKEGRKEWRAAGGAELVRGDCRGSGGGVEGC